MTITDDVQKTVDAAAETVTGTASASQAPAARTKRAWLLLAGKVLLLLAALVPGNLAFLSGADVKADVADAKAEAAYAVLRERVTYVEGQLAEVRADLADLRALLQVLVAQRVAPAAPPVVGRNGETLRAGRPPVARAGAGETAAPNPEALSDQANVADLAQALDTAEAQRVLQARAVEPPPAPLPSLDKAVERQAKAKAAGDVYE